MDRKMYQFTEKQIERMARQGLRTWTEIEAEIRVQIADAESNDIIKARWMKTHHGKARGWGLLKAQVMLDSMKLTIDYQQGIWQGRVDKARGLGYQEERFEKPYNMGYYVGYCDYESNRRGWDSATRERFDEQWVNI
jgi:hypothetical protein